MTVPLILFSGGLDSTYLVSQRLTEGPVDILYVNGGQSQDKIRLELEARDKLIEKMNSYYPHKIQGQYEVLDPVYLHNGEHKKWIQPNAWMQGAFRVITNRHSKLEVAYVSDDGANFGFHLPKIRDQWNATLAVGYANEPIPLEFPTLHLTKLDILENIDKRLLNDIWVCEIPKGDKPCGCCSPCKLINKVLWEYKGKHGETVFNTAKRVEREFAAFEENKKQFRLDRKPLTTPFDVHDCGFYKDYKGRPKAIRRKGEVEDESCTELLG